MTKEDWLHWRQQPSIPMDIWFAYYSEKGGYITNIDEFAKIFSSLITNQATVQGSDGRMKQITNATASRRMREYYDDKFELYS